MELDESQFRHKLTRRITSDSIGECIIRGNPTDAQTIDNFDECFKRIGDNCWSVYIEAEVQFLQREQRVDAFFYSRVRTSEKGSSLELRTLDILEA